MSKKGTLNVHTENIFPIIKKFLYSDHEIFLRELVSNAVDATQKIKMLASKGDYSEELGDTQIEVTIDKDAKTLTIADKGIGMGGMESGMAMAERIYPVYGLGLIVSTTILVIVSATIVSFLPAKKIAKMDPVDALKGKLQ